MKIIENVKVLLLLSILVALIFGLFCLKGINEKLLNFYEYENKKINLAGVKLIQPRVDYVVTLSKDKSEDMNRKYSTKFDLQEVAKLEEFLLLCQESDFYDIKISAYMLFDNEKINLFESKRYVKLPAHYKVNSHMLSTLQTYGIDEYQYQSLVKLTDQVFKSKEEFVNTIIDRAKLKRSDWLTTNIAMLGVGQKEGDFLKNIDSATTEFLITDDDIEEILGALKGAYDNYLGIK